MSPTGPSEYDVPPPAAVAPAPSETDEPPALPALPEAPLPEAPPAVPVAVDLLEVRRPPPTVPLPVRPDVPCALAASSACSADTVPGTTCAAARERSGTTGSAGSSHTAASGGRVTSGRVGLAVPGTSSAITEPRLPTPEPP